MSNNVPSHENVAERAAGADRRAGARQAARSLGSVTARIIGGSVVDLVNFSSRGVLFECDSRLLIGARASVRITTPEANLIVTGRVVRSRVKGLVNGALRYDAALVLDAELNLTPAIVEAVRAETRPQQADADFVVDDLINFESDFDSAGAPSPVEAYLAESEASLLEAHASESPLHFPGVVETAPVEVDAAPALAAEPPPLPDLPVAVEAAADEAAADEAFVGEAFVGEAAADEPIAFEADGDIAFEPAMAFEAAESAAAVAAIELAAAEESAGASMFDATYTPPAADLSTPAASQFVVTAPRPVQGDGSSSFFDHRPSEAYGDEVVEPFIDVDVAIHVDPVSTPGTDVAAGEASEPLDFETDVAFEAEDAVMFESVVDEAPAHIDEPPARIETGPAVTELAIAPPPDAPDGDVIDTPAPVAVTEDRVLLQFAATVPHDLTELQRIAADNQW